MTRHATKGPSAFRLFFLLFLSFILGGTLSSGRAEVFGERSEDGKAPASLVHVGGISMSKQEATYRCPGCGGVFQATARVLVLDENGTPVISAVVAGSWNDACSDTEALTDHFGQACFDSPVIDVTADEQVLFTFCVTGIQKEDCLYEPSVNAVTCRSMDTHAQETDAVIVNNIVVTKSVGAYKHVRCPGCGGFAICRAAVQVLDTGGAPVPYAVVVGSWNSDPEHTVVGITNRLGWAHCRADSFQLETPCQQATFSFCIQTVIKAGACFDPAASTITCADVLVNSGQ